MIISIDLSKLRNGEYSQLLQDMLNMTAKNDPVAMQVDVQYNALRAAATMVEALFKVPVRSAITADVEKYDLLRDNAITGILALVRGYSYSDDADVKKQADILVSHLALFGAGIAQDSYQSETSSIRNIIADWDAKGELMDAVAALNLQNWRVSLENANNSFANSYLLRAQELGTDTSENLKAIRLQANDAYYALRDNINAYYVIKNGAEPYSKVVAYINGLLSNYNDLLARRIGGNAAAEQPTPATIG